MAEETFGGRLKRLREEAGFTQQSLADAAGMHRLGVAKVERDERAPTWDTSRPRRWRAAPRPS